MSFSVKILGSNSAIPAHSRHPTSQIVDYYGHLFLIDCGEGTQFRMQEYGIKQSKIDHIFISHLHGDHYLGLIPLLSTFNLFNRDRDLYIYGPVGLKDIIDIHFRYSKTTLRYSLHIIEVEAKEGRCIFQNNRIEVHSIILKHKIPCTGFLFKEKQKLRGIIPEKLVEYAIPYRSISDLRQGKDYRTEEGVWISNKELTTPALATKSYAFCSDTRYSEQVVDVIKEVDLLYHEATFMKDAAQRAFDTFHSTSEDAAQIAKKAQVKKLLLGHFSTRYTNLEPLLDEAKEIFECTALAIEGHVFEV